MKQILTLAMAMAMTAAAFGQQTLSFTNPAVNTAIPDNNPSGLASQLAVGGLSGTISNVTLSLDITGGYNGDLYAYLAGPSAGFAVLLNRVGVSGTSAFGYSDAGFNITFDDSASHPDIHSYQNDSPVISGGQLTLTWRSDGENINPQSAPSSFTGSGGATLATFDGLDGSGANGQWTLFLADLAAGNQSTVVSWSLAITTAPEPQTWALGAMGVLLLAAVRKKNDRRKNFR